MTGTSVLPAATSIGAVHLRVRDRQRSARFYGELLGLPTGGSESSPAGRSDRARVRLTETPDSTRRPEGVIGLYHFAVLYPDRGSLAGAIRRLVAEQWRFTGFADHGVSEAAYLLDPDGIGVELYVDRPQEIWPRSADGQLTMYTRPLDVDGLVAEPLVPGSAGAAGARIGHVHFHVNDTGASREFYSDVVGFDVMLDSLPGAVFLSAGGYHHHVGVNTWARGRTADPDAAGLIAWTIRVPDPAGRRALIDRLDTHDMDRPDGRPARDIGHLTDGTIDSTNDDDCVDGYLDPDGNVLVIE